MPMISAPVGSTKPDAGVMATRPATAPETMPRMLGFLAMIHSQHIHASAAAAVAICVTAMAMPALTLAVKAEAGVNADRPTMRRDGRISMYVDVTRDHVCMTA